jgi:prepilin signal peptidase PulO-like enzyme (type II secretory pathway)
MVLPFFLFDQKYLCGKPLTFASQFDLFKSFQIIPLLLLIYIWDASSKFHSDALTIFLSFVLKKIKTLQTIAKSSPK